VRSNADIIDMFLSAKFAVIALACLVHCVLGQDTDNSTTSTTTTTTTPSPPVTPNTTTSAPDTTTSAPPTGKPAEKNVTLVNKCIKLEGIITLHINYEGVKEDINLATVHPTVDPAACHVGEDEILAVKFANSELTWTFSNKSNKYFLKELKLQAPLKINNTYEEKVFLLSDPESFIGKVDVTKGYKCNTRNVHRFNETDVTIELLEFKVHAFTEDGKEPKEYSECENDVVSDIVPIAVGCALAGLVVIVLIAYIVGRRRARQKGYQSV